MINEEKIKRIRALIKEMEELLKDTDVTKQNLLPQDILYPYKKEFGKPDSSIFFVDFDGCVEFESNKNSYSDVLLNYRERTTYFNYFFDRSYAENSAEMNQFNNRLLAFKWCYDRDYKPDWNNFEENKYFIYFNANTKKYEYVVSRAVEYISVCFSTEEIVQKCCDWLNEQLFWECPWKRYKDK